MRPVLSALSEQQQLLDGIRREASTHTAQNRQAFESLRHVAHLQGQTIRQQAAVITDQERRMAMLSMGLQAVARAAGIEQDVIAAMTKTADVQNPTQPVPEPPSEPPAQSTQDVKTPEAFADVTAPGMSPGTTQDVAADATSTVYTPGQDIDAPPVKQLVDVTRPVDGTQSPQPLNTVRTETDVRVGDPMNPQVAFPVRGDFQNVPQLGGRAASAQGGGNQKLSKAEAASLRTVASIRLAKLRIATGTADGDEFSVAAEIEKDAGLSTEAIEREITTLEGVRTVAARKGAAKPNLVPRPAGVPRTAPSMQSHVASRSDGEGDADDASDLFD